MNKAAVIFTRSCKHWKKEINVKECRRAIVLSKRAKGLDDWLLAIPVCAVVIEVLKRCSLICGGRIWKQVRTVQSRRRIWQERSW